jgi:SAM-dependent methyltransferase
VGSVLATDIYGVGDFSDNEAAAGMLEDPAAFAPYAYQRDRLQVRSMNALALDLPDASFDVVYSLSSVEHFGDFRAIRQRVPEMARVVRPGGHVVITTECLLANNWRDWTPVGTAVRALSGGRRAPHASPYRRMIDVLTPTEIDRYIVRGSGLRLTQPLDLTISDATKATESRPVLTAAGAREFGTELPHVVLRVDSAPWTSVFIALER